MVINSEETQELTIEEALKGLRLRGYSGKILAKAYKRLGEGKFKAGSAIPVAILAATAQVGDPAIRKPLLRYWARLENLRKEAETPRLIT